MRGAAFRWVTLGTLLVLFLAGIAGGVAWRQYQAFLVTPLPIDAGGATLRVAPGTPVNRMLQQLERRGLLTRDWRWQVLLRLEPVTIQAGEYDLPAGLTAPELLSLLKSGAVIQYRFTLIEGWNYRQLRAALLAEERLLVPEELLAEDQVMQTLGSDQVHPEGWFLPETYAYTAEDDALDVLRRAHAAMNEALDEAWASRVDELPIKSAYELLTLASIVEKESSLAPERPRIAGVFVRRLQQNWRLETDPTVIYGMGERYDGNIRRRDLREATPYNTYVIRGLPPTPIAMPGADALFATARPAQEAAMFFVADGTGGHVFSTTYEEHNKAVQAYIRWQRQQGAASTSQAQDS